MEVKQYLTENEHLLRKFNRTIGAVNKALKENASYGKELDSFKKTSLAIMLENVSNAFDVRARLVEGSGSQVSDIAKKNDYLNLIAAVMPTLVAEDIVSVQPIKQKAGVVFYMKHVYDDTKGTITSGDAISTIERVWPEASKIGGAIEYSSEDITNETIVQTNNTFTLAWTPVIPKSLSFFVGTAEYTDNGEGNVILKASPNTVIGTIAYSTGLVSFTNATTVKDNEVSYQMDLYTAPMKVPTVKTVITDLTVTARPRKLRTAYSLDAAFDLQMTQNVDLQSVIQGAATDEIRSEIDGEILQDLGATGTTMNVSFNQPVPFGVSRFEHYEAFLQTIVEGANKIYQKTRRITGNFVIVGENAANILETHSKFKAAASLNEAGPHVAGTLAGKYLVVKNPYFGSDEFVIGYKGDIPFDSGYVYCPYMPIVETQFIMDDTFQGRKGYATSYAKKLVSADFYCNGTITHVTE